MPKVASEVKVQANPGIRTQNRPAGKSAGDPFAALLDTVTSPDRPAPKSDRIDPSRPARKSEASDDSRTQPSDDAAPVAQDPSAPSADASSQKGDSKDQSADAAACTDTATAETKETTDADLAAAIDAAIAVPAAPQIVQAAVVVTAPAIAPVDPAADTAEGVPAITASAPVAEATPADTIPAATQAETTKPAATDTAEAATGPKTQSGDIDKPVTQAATDPSAAQKAPRDGSHVKAEGQKDTPPATIEPEAPAPKQAKPEHAEIDATPKTAHAPAPDATPTFTLSSLHAHAAANSAPAATAASPVVNAVPMSAVAVEIATQARAGGNRFEIRLDPPELGRIDVRLDVDKNGQVTTHLRVDRVETLDMLRRDAQNLERTLQDAGLKTSGNALNFSLRDQSPHQHMAERNAPDSSQYFVTDDAASQVGGTQVSAWATRLGGIDIRV